MSLHIILGFDSSKSDSIPTLVYAGRSGEAARLAREASTAARFEILQNPPVIRKNNPRATANRLALDPVAILKANLAREVARLEAEGRAAELRAEAAAKATAAAKAAGVADAIIRLIADAITPAPRPPLPAPSSELELAAAQARADQEAEPTEPPAPQISNPEISDSPAAEPAAQDDQSVSSHFATSPRRSRNKQA